MKSVKSFSFSRLTCGLILFILFKGPVFADIEKGKTVFSTMCVTCHGHDMKGGIGPNLVDDFWKKGDSAEAIFDIITHGVEGTEMMPFGAIYSEEDRKSLVDFILSKQEGFRGLTRSLYAKKYFDGKRFSLDSMNGIKYDVRQNIPENKIFLSGKINSVINFNGKLHIKEEGY